MPNVVISNLKGKTIHCREKTKKLLDILLNSTDRMRACGGKGTCNTCKVEVLQGMDNLSERSPAKTRFIKMDKLHKNERLTCQVMVNGDVGLAVPAEYQFPHLKYEE